MRWSFRTPQLSAPQPSTFALVDGARKRRDTSVDAGAERMERGSATWPGPAFLKEFSRATQSAGWNLQEQ